MRAIYGGGRVNVYPIKFRAADGTTFAGELVTEMSLQNQFWNLTPLPNGIEYSGAPPSVLWAALPNLLNQNASFSTNIATTYATPSTGITLQIVVNGVPGAALPTGLTFNTGTNLFAYNGTSVFGLTTISFLATLTATGQVFASGTFTISGVGSTSADATAPTVPVGISAINLTATTVTLTGIPSSDPAPPGANWSGLAQYNVSIPGVAGSPFTVAAPSLGTQPVLTPGDIGSQASTISLSGANITFTTTAVDSPFPTNSALAVAPKQVTGTSWWMRARVPAAFTSTGAFDNLRLEARPSLTPGAPYVAIVCTNLAVSQREVQSESRAATGGSAAAISSAALAAAQNVDLFVNRNLDTYSFFYSLDGNTLQALGSITQAMGSTLFVTGGANTASGGPMTAQTLQQFSINTDPPWSLPLTGLTPGTAYDGLSGRPGPVTVTAQDVTGNISAASATFSFTTPAAAVSAKPFPRAGIWFGTGAQLTTAANDINAAQYGFIITEGDFPSAVPSAGRTRDQIVVGLKSHVAAGTKTAVLPIVVQYQNPPDFVVGGNNQNEWLAAVNTNNWWLYLTGSSGTKQTLGDGNLGYATPCHNGGNGGSIAGISKDLATGLWPYEWAVQYLHDRYIPRGDGTRGLATGTDPAVMASSHFDGLYVDNLSQYLRESGDWNRSGVNSGVPGTGEAAVVSALFTGQADIANRFRAIDSTRFIMANTAGFALTTYGLDGTPMKGKFDFPQQQFVFGRRIEQQWQFRGSGAAAAVMAQYKSLIASSANGSCSLTMCCKPGDYQQLRHALCFTLMDNGYLQAAVHPAGARDFVDPNDLTTYPVCDEFWCGTRAVGGHLGNPLPTAQGAVQTGPWQGTIWRRDYDNGIVLVNMGQASSGPFALGGTYWHLRTTTGQAINNAASATAITLGTFNYDSSNLADAGVGKGAYAGNAIVAGDACILMNSPT